MVVVRNLNPVMEKHKMNSKDLLEYTLLHANATLKEIEAHCKTAMDNEIYAVCIPPHYVSQAKLLLENSKVKIVTVCDFPFGYSHTAAKVEDTKKSLSSGADEIDFVINFAAVKSEDWKTVKNDIESIVTICQMQDKICKAIIEISMLTQTEAKKIIALCEEAGVHYIKTGTGMLGKDVSKSDIDFIAKNTKLKIKAAGGISTQKQVQELIKAGANVIGSSKLIL